jgi:putative ABC transport system permease protein
MFRNYFRVAWRGLLNNKAFSFINIFGLGLGMACSLLIVLWVADELGMDSWHRDVNRIYMLYETELIDGKRVGGYWTPGLLVQELKRKIPEVEYGSAIMEDDRTNFEVGNKKMKMDGIDADSDYFKMFSYPLLEGSAQSALNTPGAIAISDKMARIFFGSAHSAIGETIRCENRRNYTVTAVFADVAHNSSLKFDFVINWMAHLEDNAWLKNWDNNSPSTAVMLKPGTDPERVVRKLDHFLDAYNHSFTAGFRLDLNMQPFSQVYLHSHFVDGKPAGGRIEYVRLFSLVAAFILFIACINFMNLTTARSGRRAKEIGIRKVSGAVRGSLTRQFLIEAIVLTTVAAVVALLIVSSVLPFFNQLTTKSLQLPISSPKFYAGLIVLVVVTGTLAGLYPSLFLAGLQPVRVLKGALKFTGGIVFFRKGLVVFQFVLSIMLIIGTIVVARQINYVQTADIGYNRSNLIYMPIEGELGGKFDVFREQATRLPGVKMVSSIQDRPVHIGRDITGSLEWSGKIPGSNAQFTVTAAGYDFVAAMHLQLVDGRDFSRDFPTDTVNYLVNEEAAAIFNYKNPVGQPLELWGQKGHIIGVLKNFHLTSLHEPIHPLVVRMYKPTWGNALVRVDPRYTQRVLAGLSKISSELNPQFPFTYFFADEEYRKMYDSDVIVGRLSNCFAALAIFISCMGLLGLAMFTAEQRRKEIGIRKVLGANVLSLLRLLSGEFMGLVLIALVIASPLAWWAMQVWLRDYAYRTPIEWWIFGLAGALALLIALLTVSFQSIRAALANPVKSLRADG